MLFYSTIQNACRLELLNVSGFLGLYRRGCGLVRIEVGGEGDLG